jgi:GT2 family glycosyltransferase/lipopolysaccharide/colanic/teichoic acid biosynthesis glycosyltransferase
MSCLFDTVMNRAVSSSFAAAPVTPQPSALKEIDVSVIIVNYNVREFLRQSLLSLRKALAPLAAEVFVVDNASNDGSAEMIRREFPQVQLITNRENAGFAHANNQALRRAAGRFVVLLNPDTVVQEDTFMAIRAFFDKHPETGMVGCKVLNPDGTLQLACRRSFPTPWVAFTRLSGLSQLFPKSRWFGRYNLTYLPEDEAAEVEAISGSFMAVRREALQQVGPLDERFFLYGEDLDWCFRLRAAGWKIHYFPGTQIIHYKGESAKQSDLDNLRLFYQAMSQFVRKHFRPRLFWLFYWLLHLAIWFRAAIAFAQSLVYRLAVPTMDLAFMQLSMAVAVWFRFERAEVFSRFLIVDAVYSFIWLICLALLSCYRRSTLSAYQAFVATIIGFFINASLTYFFKQYAFSRAVVLIAGGMNILLLSGWRLAVKILRQLPAPPFGFIKGRMGFGRRTVIVGDFVADGALVEKLKIDVDNRYELVGLISLEAGEVGKFYHGLPVLASLNGLDIWLNDHRIQQVIFSTQRVPIGRILQVMSRQRDQSLSFKLVPSHLDVIIGKSGIDQVNEVPLLEIENRLLQFGPALAKRVFDIFWAGFLAIVSAPFFLFAWLLLAGVRKGKLQAFTILTPRHGAIRLWQLSRGGRLAKWPWLLAILSGKLSWVGVAIPSPDAAGQVANGKKENTDAPSPLPVALPFGVTDLAKINRHAQLSEEEKNKLYLYYVTHYTPLLDLEILLRTLFRI